MPLASVKERDMSKKQNPAPKGYNILYANRRKTSNPLSTQQPKRPTNASNFDFLEESQKKILILQHFWKEQITQKANSKQPPINEHPNQTPEGKPSKKTTNASKTSKTLPQAPCAFFFNNSFCLNISTFILAVASAYGSKLRLSVSTNDFFKAPHGQNST